MPHYGATMNPTPWVPPSPQYRALEQLMRRIEQLDKMIQQEKNRLESLGSGPADRDVLDSIEKTLSYFHKELFKKIHDHLERHPDLKDDVKLLSSIPGLGELTALRMLLSFFTSPRSVSCYAARRVALLLDNAKYHHAKLHESWRVKSLSRFALNFLPTYSPELNPIERVWKLVRRLANHNRYFLGTEELTGTVEHTLSQ